MPHRKTGVLLVSHGNLCESFVDVAQEIYKDELKGVATLSISKDSDREQVLAVARQELKRMSAQCVEVIVLCDAYGATASRLICENGFEGLKVICVFGLNLPMLLDCINYRGTCPLEELADKLCESGSEGIFSKRAGGDGDQAQEG